MDRPAQVRRWLSGAYPEATIAALTFGFDALLAVTTAALPARAVLAAATVCTGAALSGWRPRLGLAVTAAGLALQLMLPPAEVGMAMFAGLVPILSSVSRRRWRLAWLGVLVVGALIGADTFRAAGTTEEVAVGLVAWAVFFALAAALGAALGQARNAGEVEADQRLDQQRRQIAIDLHDNVAHDLAMIAMRIEEVRIQGSVAPSDLDHIGDVARRSSRYLRELMALLQVGGGEASQPLDLVLVLDQCTHQLERAGFKVSRQGTFDPDGMPGAATDTLAKVAREATNNILRHGDRTQPCSLRVIEDEGALELVFSNAVSPAHARGGGLGLPGMRQRLDAVGGQLKVLESPGLWVVRATAPTE